jgi:Domain of unknown function (DUF4281)
MDGELVLKVLNIPVLLGWAAMVLAPRARLTRWVLESDAIPLVIGVVYLTLMAPHLPGVLGQFDTLEHIEAAFQRPGLLLAGWLHYLAFDLLVGRVVLADAQRRGVPHLLVVPCLVLTFLLGPTGYLAYAAVRLVTRRFLPAIASLPKPAAPLATEGVR